MLKPVSPIDARHVVGLDNDRGVIMQEMSPSMQMKMGSGMVMGSPSMQGMGSPDMYMGVTSPAAPSTALTPSVSLIHYFVSETVDSDVNCNMQLQEISLARGELVEELTSFRLAKKQPYEMTLCA